MSTPPSPQGEHTAPPAPGTPAPEAAKPKGSKAKKFLRFVALVVVALVVKFGISYFFNSPVRAEAGDCVKVTGSENSPEVETKGCDDKDANYKVLKVVENTFDTSACTVGEAALAQQWEQEKFVLCLEPVKH
ncbi:hypothetical protein ACFWHQ_18990 [Streptomyces sp. NPDC060334]|uniref:LppU/SCO3897 family protein n=1 Tax=unclassified Streptomyces TaxID=2593676 RepID=UPI0006AE5F9F|nr:MULTISPECIES: hypothetical protein [unclassified Streptomyces]KOU57311.1 hypothetical protein ADK55_12765 [Streptomyces sp. WM4235]MCX5077253.1 hypothetical protein [Streptomyces sp. NBC_00424]WUD39760.1 hypothetical protein OHA84_04205 [Streptomyces sp. NBC_00513]